MERNPLRTVLQINARILTLAYVLTLKVLLKLGQKYGPVLNYVLGVELCF